MSGFKRASFSLAISLVLGLAPLRAQNSLRAPSEWLLSGSQGDWCIEYLVDSATATKLAPKGTVLSAAVERDDLLPVLARVVRDEPQFSQWVPARFCIGLYSSATRDGQVVATAKPGKPLVWATHTLAARSYLGQPTGEVALAVYIDNADLSRAWDKVGQKARKIKLTVTPGANGSDPKTLIDFDGMKLSWDGAAKGDSSVVQTRTVSFGYVAQRGNEWLARGQVTGGEAQRQYGALTVLGKNAIARTFLASPIRVIGALSRGGSLNLKMQVVTPEQ